MPDHDCKFPEYRRGLVETDKRHEKWLASLERRHRELAIRIAVLSTLATLIGGAIGAAVSRAFGS